MARQRSIKPKSSLEASYAEGWADGVRDGACQSAAATVAQPIVAKRELRILYVPQGFPAIDQGVMDALQQHAGTVHQVHPSGMEAAAAEMRPDLVLVMNGLHVFPDNQAAQISAIRAMGIRTAIWFADDPYFSRETKQLALVYDHIFTHELEAVDFYRSLGAANVSYMPLGVNPALFKAKQVEREYRSDICFVGQGFWNRIALFNKVLPSLEGRRVVIAGGEWQRLRQFKRYKRWIRQGFMPVEETVNFYNGAKIVLNVHRTTNPGLDNHNDAGLRGASINPRTYEIAACGTLQMTDVRDDLPRYFTPGRELVTFQTPLDLVSKINYFLENEHERRAIAVRGMLRTMREHTFVSRVGALLNQLGL
ncbi:glycosyltransferase [Paenibacillus pasadenensis]|uniref:CgeB family protein n=1 Tax=Paenibacillus pasadenensis TaxID=217090 RepID=UPI0020412BB2|nr:glycosyltransferase [Paenibacillus pasadenensis]MCM3746886.1 glycosyltransferase [Paenibacillus pasadenensis]